MPHDANGELLKVGDAVWIQVKIKEIFMAEDFCNLTVETCRKMPGNNEPSTFSNLNAKQVEKKP